MCNYMCFGLKVKKPSEDPTYIAALTGEVMLTALLRFFAAKVTILLNPFERLVSSF